MREGWMSLAVLILGAISAFADVPPGPTKDASDTLPALGLSAIGVVGIVWIVRRRRSRRPKQ